MTYAGDPNVNFMVNPSFEIGAGGGGWDLDPSSNQGGPASNPATVGNRTGDWVYGLFTRNFGGDTRTIVTVKPNDLFFKQRLLTGRSYSMSFYVNSFLSGTGGVSVNLQVWVDPGDGTYVLHDTRNGATTYANTYVEWTPVTSFTVTSAAVRIQLRSSATQNPSGLTNLGHYIDDVVLTDVTAAVLSPASASDMTDSENEPGKWQSAERRHQFQRSAADKVSGQLVKEKDIVTDRQGLLRDGRMVEREIDRDDILDAYSDLDHPRELEGLDNDGS